MSNKTIIDQLNSSSQLWDDISSKHNHINKLSIYLQYLHSNYIVYLDSAASNNFGNKQISLANISNTNNSVSIYLTNN